MILAHRSHGNNQIYTKNCNHYLHGQSQIYKLYLAIDLMALRGL